LFFGQLNAALPAAHFATVMVVVSRQKKN